MKKIIVLLVFLVCLTSVSALEVTVEGNMTLFNYLFTPTGVNLYLNPAGNNVYVDKALDVRDVTKDYGAARLARDINLDGTIIVGGRDRQNNSDLNEYGRLKYVGGTTDEFKIDSGKGDIRIDPSGNDVIVDGNIVIEGTGGYASGSGRVTPVNGINVSGDIQYGGVLIGASPLKIADNFCMKTPSGNGAECGPDDNFNWVCKPSNCWDNYEAYKAYLKEQASLWLIAKEKRFEQESIETAMMK